MTGCLDECPWNELLRFVEQLRFTGSLRLSHQGELQSQAQTQRPPAKLPTKRSARQTHELWFEDGFLVGAAKVSRSNSLFWLMQHQGWLSYATAQQLAKCCPAGVAVGNYFRQQGAVSSQQLQQLFQLQIMAALTTVSDWDGAMFELQSEAALPCDRLTGLRLSAYDAINLYCQRRSAVLAASSSVQAAELDVADELQEMASHAVDAQQERLSPVAIA